MPLTLHDVGLQIPHEQEDRQFEHLLALTAPSPVDIVFVNPDLFEQALRNVAKLRKEPASRYIVAVWFWELETVPEAWRHVIQQVDEIVVASSFVERAFRGATDKPVTRVPLPLGVVADSGLGRDAFGIAPDAFVFLTSFDFNSSIDRKNPADVIAAFRRAFPEERRDVRLLIKTSNGQRHEEKLVELLECTKQDSRIIVRDGVLERDHMHALQRCCDAYVSLHRAEGFGLGMAESMAIGKPVIATGWSGNLEFMTSENSWLVGYDLVPVPSGAYPSAEGQRWAQPSIEQASRCMQEVADDAALRAYRSARGKDDVLRSLCPKTAAAIFNARIFAASAHVTDRPNDKAGMLENAASNS
ncbi:glycosyltransferase family 4 protein [Luteimonas abyssi]|uniref:glycosyltransferase family 4 protein n=1 Tax=Luteimonas abyssi TaxID=1247514 RepID=UPI00138F513A|nr:glycosyltransferase family 4 protein [Luteimonas abyssi]